MFYITKGFTMDFPKNFKQHAIELGRALNLTDDEMNESFYDMFGENLIKTKTVSSGEATLSGKTNTKGTKEFTPPESTNTGLMAGKVTSSITDFEYKLEINISGTSPELIDVCQTDTGFVLEFMPYKSEKAVKVSFKVPSRFDTSEINVEYNYGILLLDIPVKEQVVETKKRFTVNVK